MKKKFEDILDKLAFGLLLLFGFAGFLQIFVVFWLTLFGIQYHWLQYVATVVLFGLGILSLFIWARLSNDEKSQE